MKSLFIFLFSLLFLPVFSQEIPSLDYVTIDGKQYVMHPVTAGETLYSIGRRYQLEVISILNENPQLISGLKTGDVLKIPVVEALQTESAVSAPAAESTIGHLVQRRETLFSVSRQYGVTIDDILRVNPGLVELRRGETIRIPTIERPIKPQQVLAATATTQSVHQVVQGETLYSISRRYGQTVAELLERNPHAANLQPGMELVVTPDLGAERISFELSAPVEEGFMQHTIAPGETLYRITRQYGVTAERLVELNPELSNSFRTGSSLRIPVFKTGDEGIILVKYVAAASDTPALLAERFGSGVDELVRHNPFLKSRELKQGDTLLLVPAGLTAAATSLSLEGAAQMSLSDCEQMLYSNQKRKELSMVLLLPLSIDANVASLHPIAGDRSLQFDANPDSMLAPAENSAVQSGIMFSGNSENFIHFYEGVLLAVDSLERSGVNVAVRVVDTDRYRGRMRQIISDGHLQGVDLIIGPVQPADQREVSEYAARNQIFMVSPLSASDELTRNNPYYFQINPTREIINRNTAHYLVRQYAGSNFVFLQVGSSTGSEESAMAASIRENLRATGGPALKVCEFHRVGIAGLTSMLSPSGKNVVIIASANEAEVSVGVSNIHTIAAQFDITIIGTNRFAQFESINQEYYHRGRLEFLAPYFPDYTSQVTRSFVQQFRTHFKTEPNQFSIQGFDTSLFFLTMVSNFGRHLHRCLDCGQPGLVQGKYQFSKIPQGGYMNEGLTIVSYNRDYKVTGRSISLPGGR